MRTLDYKEYFDRVYGCWLGKSIAGTIGAPLEGRKELFRYQYDKRSIEKMLPNDDLDLQVVWLDVMERKGIYFTSHDLAEAFYENYKPSPGEYAYFKKNYCRGIMPPASGWYNNQYYMNGMGCPIRSEIWACVAPGNAGLAREFSVMDGSLDHGKDSVEGEIFLAALESEAFFQQDLNSLIENALKLLEPEGNMRRLLEDVIRWCGQYDDFVRVRGLILENWGHADCTNLYQNMGFTLMALLLGKGDFLDTAMMALNCGFDTDCSCATAGAVLGILYGADYLMEKYGFTDTGYVLEAEVKRPSLLLYDLAKDTCRAGMTMAEYRNTEVRILNQPDYTPLPHEYHAAPVSITVDYLGDPAIGYGETKKVELILKSNIDTDAIYRLSLVCPNDWTAELPENVAVPAGSEACVEVTLTADCTEGILCEKNILTFAAEKEAERYTLEFGIAGAAVWTVYGPFWNNNRELPEMPSWESYYPYFQNSDEVRQYHLNTFADIDREYIREDDFFAIEDNRSDTCSMLPRLTNIKTDCFHISDFVKFKGSCVVYMVREMLCREEMTVCMNIGHTAPYKLWINGKLTDTADGCDWWTAENHHVEGVALKKGLNRIVLKAARIGDNGSFSLVFNHGTMTEHYYDFGSEVIRQSV